MSCNDAPRKKKSMYCRLNPEHAGYLNSVHSLRIAMLVMALKLGLCLTCRSVHSSVPFIIQVRRAHHSEHGARFGSSIAVRNIRASHIRKFGGSALPLSSSQQRHSFSAGMAMHRPNGTGMLSEAFPIRFHVLWKNEPLPSHCFSVCRKRRLLLPIAASSRWSRARISKRDSQIQPLLTTFAFPSETGC